MALAFGKIASLNGHSLREASLDIRPHVSEELLGRRKTEAEGGLEGEKGQPEGVLEVPYFLNCTR